MAVLKVDKAVFVKDVALDVISLSACCREMAVDHDSVCTRRYDKGVPRIGRGVHRYGAVDDCN